MLYDGFDSQRMQAIVCKETAVPVDHVDRDFPGRLPSEKTQNARTEHRNVCQYISKLVMREKFTKRLTRHSRPAGWVTVANLHLFVVQRGASSDV